MVKYLIYIALAALVVWSVVYLVRHIRGQMKGDCGSCKSCSGGGGSCGGCGEKR